MKDVKGTEGVKKCNETGEKSLDRRKKQTTEQRPNGGTNAIRKEH